MTYDKTSIIHGGKKIWENTPEFRDEAARIREEVTERYRILLQQERNGGKRWLMKIRRYWQIRKRLTEISSHRNLHVGGAMK